MTYPSIERQALTEELDEDPNFILKFATYCDSLDLSVEELEEQHRLTEQALFQARGVRDDARQALEFVNNLRSAPIQT